VTRFPARSPPACTALSLAIESAGRFACLLPYRRFLRPQDRCFQARRLLPLSRDRVTRNGLSLSHNGCHLSATSIPGSTFQTCYFAPFQIGFRTRSAFWLHYRVPVCPGHGRFIASGPLYFHLPVWLTAPIISTPPRDFCIPQDQSVQRRLLPAGPPGEFARSPFAPRSRFFFKSGLRITVPGPLRFRRLAVPQTSWNHLHYAPDRKFGQYFLFSV
jgi:hypothetical protein